ncbi:MAG: AAA family ATPase [Comamonadaceae bacterium]|nr:AAA family ATPase [Comamonadaceae bacterium]
MTEAIRGRAGQLAGRRCASGCRATAFTVHRLLGAPGRTASSTTPAARWPSTLLIVDEASMLDLALARRLLRGGARRRARSCCWATRTSSPPSRAGAVFAELSADPVAERRPARRPGRRLRRAGRRAAAAAGRLGRARPARRRRSGSPATSASPPIPASAGWPRASTPAKPTRRCAGFGRTRTGQWTVRPCPPAPPGPQACATAPTPRCAGSPTAAASPARRPGRPSPPATSPSSPRCAPTRATRPRSPLRSTVSGCCARRATAPAWRCCRIPFVVVCLTLAIRN